MANAEQKITMIPIAMMLESKFNPRQSFDEASQADLVSSIKEKGIITPLIVRPAGLEGEYEIIAGSRRFRAAQKLGIKELPAIVLELNDEQARELAITDNLHHKDVAPLDEAEGYFSLMKLSKRSIAGVAAKLGKPPEYIAGRLKLVDLSDRAKKALREDEITIGHALLLARLSKQDQDKIVARSKYSGIQTVNQLKRQIEEQFFLDLAKAPWSMDDANLFRAAGACKVCPKRSGFNKELFGDVQKRDICSDSQCYNLKLKAFLDLDRWEFGRRKERFD